MLLEVVFALVVVSIVGTSEPSSKVKSSLHEDLQKDEQALDMRIDALLDTVLNSCDETLPVSEEELDAELARMSVPTARVEPISAHTKGTDLEIETELSVCSDASSVNLPNFHAPVYCLDDSDSESLTPELTLFSEQSSTSNQSTLQSSLGRVCSTVLSFDPEDQ